MLESRMSVESHLSSTSWTTGESSRCSSDSGRGGYSSGEGGSYQCVATLSGHSGPVASLAVRGNAIYSGGSDESDIRVWRQPEMTEGFRVRSGDGVVKALIVDGDLLFSAHQDKKIRVWRTAPGAAKGPKLIASLPTLKDYLLRCVPQKNYVEIGRHKKSLWIQHNDAISVLAKGTGNVLYSGSWDKCIKVWRTSDFRCVESISGHDDAISALVTDRQGYLYSSSADASVKVWARADRRHSLLATLVGHKSSVNSLAFSSDESLLYAASSDKTVSIWERCEGEGHMKLVGRLKGHRQAVLCMAAVGDILCTGSADKTIRVWRRNSDSHSLVAVLEGHRGPVRSVCVSTEAVQMGVMVYSGSMDRSVKVWWLAPLKDICGGDFSSGSSPQRLKWR